MQSFKRKASNRRAVYLSLVGAIESGLRDAYAKRHDAGEETQSSIARTLGISRSAVNRRLKGQSNMTLETVADMVWALGQCIDVEIFDPKEKSTNGHKIVPVHQARYVKSKIGETAPEVRTSSSKYSVQTSNVQVVEARL